MDTKKISRKLVKEIISMDNPTSDDIKSLKWFIVGVEKFDNLFHNAVKYLNIHNQTEGFKMDTKYEHPENKVSEKEKQERIEEGKLVAKAIFNIFKKQ